MCVMGDRRPVAIRRGSIRSGRDADPIDSPGPRLQRYCRGRSSRPARRLSPLTPMNALVSGFGIGLSLILAIGAQNAFVLRHGLRREHVGWICLVCATSDAALIAMGVLGFDAVIRRAPWLVEAMRYAGSAFLLFYGLRSMHSAFKSSTALVPSDAPAKPLAATLAVCLALTWLNPHVYLDTVILIGSLSTQFPDNKLQFAVGAATASLVFFFALGYGAALLRPVFAKPVSWRYLEALIAITMWILALSLLMPGPVRPDSAAPGPLPGCVGASRECP